MEGSKFSAICLIYFGLAVASALPTQDHVIAKMDPGPRFQYVQGPDGLKLEDMWLKISDLKNIARYNPDTQNAYHLFTRSNRQTSQPLAHGNTNLLSASNYRSSRRTIVLVHGWQNTPTSEFFTVLVPAFLDAADVNVIMADWSRGAAGDYTSSLQNAITSGASVARFITWLNQNSGSTISQYHLVGHSLGGHQVGIIGRNLNRNVPYITSLDPAMPGWITNSNRFQSNDGRYTEVMHTNAGVQGFLSPLGHVDFYPNGGTNMAGCSSSSCSHHRCNYYMAESLRSGGFTGRRCNNVNEATAGNCGLSQTLRMGGLNAKTGSTGIYHLTTNAGQPFSRG